MTKQYDNFADLITFTRASTGTYLDSDGLLKTATTNTPRIEFDINGNRKGILIEEARTNLLAGSNTWTGTFQATLTDNVEVSWTGLTDLRKLTEDTNAGVHQTSQPVSLSASTTHTVSALFKSGTRLGFGFTVTSPGMSSAVAHWNLSNGTLYSSSNCTPHLEDFGNGLYRLAITFTTVTGGTSTIREQLHNGTSSEYTGDGVSFAYLGFVQVEIGSFPTSYIPTAGAAASRSADVASIPTSAFGYNADKGTVVVEASGVRDVTGFSTRRFVEIVSETNNRMILGYNGLDATRFLVVTGGSLEADVTVGSTPSGSPIKMAAAYALNDTQQASNGVLGIADTSAAVPVVNTFILGRDITATIGTVLNGHIKSLAYYPRKLTPAQLQRLTS